MQTFCPFTYAALRALALCNCAEAANPAVVPPFNWARWQTAEKHQDEGEFRQSIAAQLNWQADDLILEIGFGAGDTLGWLLAQTPRGHVIGVERSTQLVTQAARRHQFSIKAGRLELDQAEPEALPYEFARFSKVLVATDYATWQTAEYCLNEVQRVLQTGGRLAIGIPLKTRRRREGGFTFEEAQEVAGLVRWVGFQEVELKHGEGWACVTATR
ncbi:MAG: class I SAM-dependent methyltransferase [Acidobacteria bacterium]|nr:class I SAM-dependent methyltransferase [Acidobacteriota bacterium]